MKISLYYSEFKRPKGRWIVKFDAGPSHLKSHTWYYRRQENAFGRFNELREKYPAWPFSVLGFRSEPDPVAPRIRTMPLLNATRVPAIVKEFKKESPLYAMLQKGRNT